MYIGIKGFVRNEVGEGISYVIIFVYGIYYDIYLVSDGDYWRFVVFGNYFVSVYVLGYIFGIKSVVVFFGFVILLDFVLR